MPATVLQAADRRTLALRELGLLRSDRFERFDAIVQIAASLCDTPMASLSVNDQSRERFISCRGFSLDKIPAEKGFSDSIISGNAPLVVNDTRTDVRFRNAPLLGADFGVRFYAGAPVVTSDGVAIGTLAVMDRAVRHLPDAKLAALSTLGAQVALMLESARARAPEKPSLISLRPTGVTDARSALNLVFNGMPGALWLLEADELRVIAASDASLAALGLARESVLGVPMDDVLRRGRDATALAEVDKVLASIRRVARTGKPDSLVRFRFSVPRKTGEGMEERYWNVIHAPVRDARGKLVYIVNHSEDITELVQLRASAGGDGALDERALRMEADMLARTRDMEQLTEHLRLAQNVANVGSWEIGIGGDARICSDEVYSILGFNPKEHPQSDDIILDATHPDDRVLLLEKRAAAMNEDGAFDVTHRVVLAEGAVEYVRQRARLACDANGAPLKLCGTIQNVTRERQVENELLKRVRQQEVVARLGQKALSGMRPEMLWKETARAVARTLDVEYCEVLELMPGNSTAKLVAGAGWKKGLAGKATVDVARHSLAGYALLSKQPVIVTDLGSETRFEAPPLLRDHSVVSGISAIIAGKSGPWGLLGAHSTRRRQFTQDDVNFFESVAHILTEAVYRAHVAKENAARAAYQRALFRLAREVVQGCAVRELQDLATRLVTETLDVEYSNVKELLADGSGMQVIAGTGWQKGVVGHVVVASGRNSHGGYVMGAEKPVTVTDLPNETRFRPSPHLLDHGVDSSASVVIAAADGAWGLLGAYTTRRRWFTDEELSFLQDVARILADARLRGNG